MQLHDHSRQRHPASARTSKSTAPTPTSPTSRPKHIKFTESESPLIHATETPAATVPHPFSPSSPTTAAWAPPPQRYTPHDEKRALARATSRRFRRYVRAMCEAEALAQQLEEEEERTARIQKKEEGSGEEEEDGPEEVGVKKVDHFRFEFPFQFAGSDPERVDDEKCQVDYHEEEEEEEDEEEQEEEDGDGDDEGAEGEDEEWEGDGDEEEQDFNMEDDEHDYPAGYAHDPEDEDDPDYYAEDEYHLDDDEQDVDDEYYDKEQEWYGSESYSHDSSQELVAALREETRKLSEELAQSRDEMKRTLGQIKTRLGKVAKSVKRKRELEGVAEEEGQLGGQVEEVEVQESIAKRTKFHNKCEKGYPFVADVVWTLGSAAVGAVLGVAAVGMIC